jgi:hypothetical protein
MDSESPKWTTVKSGKGKKASSSDAGGDGAAKKIRAATAGKPTPPMEPAGGVIDPDASAFSALDALTAKQEKTAAAAAASSEDDGAEEGKPGDDGDDDGFSVVTRKKKKPPASASSSSAYAAADARGQGVDGAFGWAPIPIPGQPMPKKPKAPRPPKTSLRAAASAIDATALTTYLREVRSISHWSPHDRVGVVNADP